MSNNALSGREYLALVFKRIGEFLDEAYGEELNRQIEQKFCSACVARLQRAADANLAPPEETAMTLVRKAGGVKSIPSQARWYVDSELKRKLEFQLDLFARTLMGTHVEAPVVKVTDLTGAVSVLIQMPNDEFKQLTPTEMLRGLIWSELSKDGAFLRRVMASFEAYDGRMSFEQFREGLLDDCVQAKVGGVAEAITVLDRLTRRYATEHLS